MTEETLIYDANGSVIAAVDAPEVSPEGCPYYYRDGKHVGYFIGGSPTLFKDMPSPENTNEAA